MLRHGLSECEAGFKLIRGQASSYTRDKCEMCELGKLALGRASFDPVHASYGRLDTCVDCKELAGVECQGCMEISPREGFWIDPKLVGQVRFGGCSSSLHSGIEFGRSRTGEGSSGGRKRGMV